MSATGIEIPKWLLHLMSHLYEIETKVTRAGDPGNALRNVHRIKEALASESLFYEDPFGQDFNETRTDLEATISGERTDSLKVVEVIKPIVRYGTAKLSRVVQRGIVVVESQAHSESPSQP